MSGLWFVICILVSTCGCFWKLIYESQFLLGANALGWNFPVLQSVSLFCSLLILQWIHNPYNLWEAGQVICYPLVTTTVHAPNEGFQGWGQVQWGTWISPQPQEGDVLKAINRWKNLRSNIQAWDKKGLGALYIVGLAEWELGYSSRGGTEMQMDIRPGTTNVSGKPARLGTSL